MSFQRKKVALALALTFGVGGTAALLADAASAADERITVTGSNIKRTDVETSSPVQVITREDIERTGKQSIQEVLRGITGDNQGSLPTAFTNGFASGAAGVSLRGLGLNSTLVLVNGRRMAPYGLADDGARVFVDVNSIPLEAVERVEVLKDGASAIYGSDAVGGVVNIIMRRDYKGFSGGGSVGTSYRGDGTIGRGYASGGWGDIVADKYNVFMSVEASKEQHIKQSTRPTPLGSSDLRSIGWFDNRRGAPQAGFGAFPDGPAFSATVPTGTVRLPGGNPSQRINLTPCPTALDPVTGVCPFDISPYLEVSPQEERANFFGRGAYQITPNMQAYLELGFFHTKTTAVGTPGGLNDGGVFNPTDPTNPVVHTTVLPANHPDNPTGVPRTLSLLTTDLGGRDQTTDNNVTRIVGGLKGDAWGWDYDFGVAYLESKLKNRNTGFVRYSVMQQALNDGTYRINQPALNSPELIAAISPALEETAKNSVSLIDFKATRDLMQLPGGPLGIAVGAEYRKEKTNSPPVPFTDVSDIVGLGFSAFSSDRNVSAAFAELNAPVIKNVEINGAVRTDHYSDVGNSTTPRVGVKWTPIPQLGLRGSYSESFRAPGPTESGNSSSLGFTTIAIISVGDPSVKSEKAKVYSFGAIIEPWVGTSATIDYYEVKRRDEIVQADPAAILGNLPQTGVPNSKIPGLQPNSLIFYDADGLISGVLGPYANANSTTTRGLDVDLRHRMDLKDAGKITAELNWTHLFTFKRMLKDGTTFEYAGTQGPIVLSSGAGTPKDKATLSVTWERAAWAVTGTVNYVGPLDAIDHKGEGITDNGDGTISPDGGEGTAYFGSIDGPVCGVYNPDGSVRGNCKIPSFTTFDLFAKWTPFKHWEFTGSIQNLFGRVAPFDPYTLAIGYSAYNQAFHHSGAVGTFYTVGAKYTF